MIPFAAPAGQPGYSPRVMSLPDVGRLLSLPREEWAALGRRLAAIGFTAEAFAPYAKLSSLARDAQRAWIAKWRLRRAPGPGAHALRMLAFSDPVSPAEAREVLGAEQPLERWIDVGLLSDTERGVVSPFVTHPHGSQIILGDDLAAGGEAVMGAAPSSRSLAVMARPRPGARAGRALDLGCGAGTLALSLAQRCDRVVATDVSERAVVVARVNAALNGVANVEVRAGDLWEAVAGERFDLVASQPPFVARADDAAPTTFLFGGERGDELAERILRGLVDHLAPAGIGFVLAEWPIIEGDEALDDRIASAVGPGSLASVLELLAEDTDVDGHCARYASMAHATLGEAYERDAIRRRDHYERMGILALRPTVIVVRRGGAGHAWHSVVSIAPGAGMSRARIDAMFAAHDEIAAGRVEGELTVERLGELEQRFLREMAEEEDERRPLGG
jgi:SAM-dependent methyltransferase